MKDPCLFTLYSLALHLNSWVMIPTKDGQTLQRILQTLPKEALWL